MKEKRQRTPEEEHKLAEWITKTSRGEMIWVMDLDSITKLKKHLKKIDYQLRQVDKLLKDLPEYI